MLSVNQDAKTIKGVKRGYLTGILCLAPHTLSGRNLCPNASPGCIATCLNTAGRGAFNSVQRSRIAKTKQFTAAPTAFLYALVKDIKSLERKAKRQRMIPLVRLNGTSDIPWENVSYHYPLTSNCRCNVMQTFPHIQFYDYTKSYARMWKFINGGLPSNYHLTFSRSECNDDDAVQILKLGGNVAVVFSTRKGEKLPAFWNGYRVIDGDIDDVRPYDPSGVVIGLRAKGKARKDTTGFVVHV